MDLAQAERDVLLGASLPQVASSYRRHLIEAFGFRDHEVTPNTFQGEVATFLRSLARRLGEQHAGNPRVGTALRAFVLHTEYYEVWDALLSGFAVDGREALVRRGKMLFPGPLTAHWDSA